MLDLKYYFDVSVPETVFLLKLFFDFDPFYEK